MHGGGVVAGHLEELAPGTHWTLLALASHMSSASDSATDTHSAWNAPAVARATKAVPQSGGS